MNYKRCNYSAFFSTILLLLSSLTYSQLDYNFYVNSCPNLVRIVRNGVLSAIRNETRISASLLRMHFHDCFVQGCDGSILLDDNGNASSEKNAFPNRNSIRGFEVIDSIKADVERACPCQVSCTDILAIAVREAVYFGGGPYWSLPLGRRDGINANQTAANTYLPSPLDSLQNIIAKFAAKGLTQKDVVVLSGAHTIGYAQCFTFKNRLFNFNNSGQPDLALSSSFLQTLQSLCPNNASSNTNLTPIDPVTTYRFDNVYYKNLLNGSALLGSDQALMEDPNTASMVTSYSNYPYLFSRDFGASMVRMASIGVIIGHDGQIRANCRVVN